MKHFKLIALLVFSFNLLFAQQENEEFKCLEKVKTYCKKVGNMQVPAAKQVYSFKYNMTLAYWDSVAQPVVNQDVQIKISRDYREFITAKAEYYHDNLNLVVVAKDIKSVFVSPSTLAKSQDNTMGSANMFRDTLFTLYKSLKLTTYVDENKRTIQRLEIFILDEYKSAVGVNKMVYHYCPAENRVVKSEVFYNASNAKKYEVVTIKEEQYTSSEKVGKNAYKKVFAKKGVLNAKYKGYKIIDKNSK
ncbi:MAG: hypothetical protein ACKOXB_12445 [Flavobacteriales bacterium]